jgi:hypothetical protein
VIYVKIHWDDTRLGWRATAKMVKLMVDVIPARRIMKIRDVKLRSLSSGAAYAWTATIVMTRKGAINTISRDMMERYGSLIGSERDWIERKPSPEVTAYASFTTKADQAPTIPKTRSLEVKPGCRIVLTAFMIVTSP